MIYHARSNVLGDVMHRLGQILAVVLCIVVLMVCTGLPVNADGTPSGSASVSSAWPGGGNVYVSLSNTSNCDTITVTITFNHTITNVNSWGQGSCSFSGNTVTWTAGSSDPRWIFSGRGIGFGVSADTSEGDLAVSSCNFSYTSTAAAPTTTVAVSVTPTATPTTNPATPTTAPTAAAGVVVAETTPVATSTPASQAGSTNPSGVANTITATPTTTTVAETSATEPTEEVAAIVTQTTESSANGGSSVDSTEPAETNVDTATDGIDSLVDSASTELVAGKANRMGIQSFVWMLPILFLLFLAFVISRVFKLKNEGYNGKELALEIFFVGEIAYKITGKNPFEKTTVEVEPEVEVINGYLKKSDTASIRPMYSNATSASRRRGEASTPIIKTATSRANPVAAVTTGITVKPAIKRPSSASVNHAAAVKTPSVEAKAPIQQRAPIKRPSSASVNHAAAVKTPSVEAKAPIQQRAPIKRPSSASVNHAAAVKTPSVEAKAPIQQRAPIKRPKTVIEQKNAKKLS